MGFAQAGRFVCGCIVPDSVLQTALQHKGAECGFAAIICLLPSCPAAPTPCKACCLTARPPPPPPPPSADDYRQEQLDYFSKTAAWTDVHPSQVVGSAACFKAYDLHTVTLEELKAPLKVGAGAGRGGAGVDGDELLRRGVQGCGFHCICCCCNGCRHQSNQQALNSLHSCSASPALPQASFQMRVLEDGPVDAFCGWFDTQFKGSAENATTTEVTLSTAPDPTGATHWGQQVRLQLGGKAPLSMGRHCAGPCMQSCASGADTALSHAAACCAHCTHPLLVHRTATALTTCHPIGASCRSRSSCTRPSSARRATCCPATLRWCGARTTSG